MDLTFGVTLQAIENVDKDSLTGYFWLYLEWVDENLVWDSRDRDFFNKKVTILSFLRIIFIITD